jgi:hypothetical protein
MLPRGVLAVGMCGRTARFHCKKKAPASRGLRNVRRGLVLERLKGPESTGGRLQPSAWQIFATAMALRRSDA